ncbi:hypothetical protein HHL11_10470 [Ramlibacter sp. G-1-2-2]|uniref:Uncharacterized protein n=1 Tax=Ramlibacter agri TaxID=2728837 RepID=A0A848H035_9BURK|nr:hypothetical protein [Ramlibacter agri]NML44175.1 hypothetical protein [Ramlibacter agri]
MTLPGLPPLPEFWTASFGFWFFFVPVHVVLFGVLARLRGLPSALGISAGMAAGSLLAATLLEALFSWLFGPAAGAGAGLAAQALRDFAPWPIGFAIVCFAVAARTRHQEREFAEFVESLKTGL